MTDQGVVRRGSANRISGVRAQSHRTEVCGHRGRGSAARPGRHKGEVIRISRDAGDRARRFVGAEGPFGHVRLRQEDGAGAAKPLHHEGIRRRYESFHGQRAAGGLQILRVVIVFDDDCDALQAVQRVRQLKFGIKFIGFGQCLRIDDNQRIQARALIVGLNTPQILFDDLMASHAVLANGTLRLRDRGLGYFKAFAGSCA